MHNTILDRRSLTLVGEIYRKNAINTISNLIGE